MKKNRLMLFVLSVIFMMGFCCQAMAQSNAGVLWLGTKSLPAEFKTEVVKGNVPGHSLVRKFGKGTVGAALVPICPSLIYQTPTTATALEFVSADADDTAAGLGAREITIIGLDANWNQVTQVIATNGLTAVPLPTNLTRLYRWFVSASGVYATQTVGSHQGILTIRVASAGATWSNISMVPFPKSQSEIGVFSVPTGFKAYVFFQDIQVDSIKSVDLTFFWRAGIDVITAPFEPMRIVSNFVGLSGTANPNITFPVDGFQGPCDIGYMGQVATATASISVEFEILLVADGF